MKIPSQTSRRDQDGMAVIAVIAILSIILIFVAGNLRTLHLLRSDLKLIEKQQIKRLVSAGPITNSSPITNAVPASGNGSSPPTLRPK